MLVHLIIIQKKLLKDGSRTNGGGGGTFFKSDDTFVERDYRISFSASPNKVVNDIITKLCIETMTT